MGFISGQSTIIDSRCVKLNIRPYLPPKIVYQYENELAQTIESNGGILSYAITEKPNQCNGLQYRLNWQRARYSGGTFVNWHAVETKSSLVWAFNAPYSNPRIYIDNQLITSANDTSKPIEGKKYSRYSQTIRLNIIDSTGQDHVMYIGNHSSGGAGLRLLGFTLVNPNDFCPPACEFVVSEKFYDASGYLYKTNIRHQEIRQECPNVQQFGCSLGAIETIEEKLNPFEVLFLTDGTEFEGYFADVLDSLDASEIINYLAGNPDNCLLIWKVKYNTFPHPEITQIAQICSAQGCPPPSVNYECSNCGCPDDTCAVECGDHICCYDKNGIAVLEIPLNIYSND